MMYLIHFTVFILVLFLLQLLNVDATSFVKNILVSGPGLKPQDIVLPSRYIFLYDSNSSEPFDKQKLIVRLHGTKKNHKCRLYSQILTRRDLPFAILRYKLYEECSSLTLEASYGSSSFHLDDDPKSPKNAELVNNSFVQNFDGPIYPEECDCPVESVDSWMEAFECGSLPKQIFDDLRRYPSVNFDKVHKEAIKRFNNSMSSSVCHYVIKSNKLYRSCYGQHTDFKMFMDNVLLSLMRKVVLPDVEFYSNLGDWPLMPNGSPINFPMFSWCGSEDTEDIVMPTYDLAESTLGAMGRVMLDVLSIQGNIEKTWDEKEHRAFWRGRDSSRERLKLVGLSRKYPELIDASLTNFFFFTDMKEKYGPKVDHVSFFKFFDYKYQLNLDGTVAAYRFPYLLAGDSLVFKQDSKYYEHFYSEIAPWEHFIPVKSDLSDIIERLKWAINNDEKARKIALNGNSFALKNLHPTKILCYYVHLLVEWSKRLESTVVVREGMEHVKQPRDENECKCDAARTKNLKSTSSKDEF